MVQSGSGVDALGRDARVGELFEVRSLQVDEGVAFARRREQLSGVSRLLRGRLR